MDTSSELDRVMALAGIYQATSLVQQVAHAGSFESEFFTTSINSIFQIDSQSTAAVFGGWSQVRCGLETLCRQLGKHDRDLELTRYAVCLLFLERRIMRRRDLMGCILDGVKDAAEQAQYFSITHDCVLANLAQIYASTVSTVSPRIMVTGTPAYLNNSHNANKIRALLLAGLRATVLWRQLGGNRWQLIFGRRRLAQSANNVLAELQA